MPFVRVDDLVVHYELTGPADAPVVAFGNSLGTSYSLWDDNVGALVDRFRLLRYDMRGQRFAATLPQRVEALALCATGNQLGTAELWNTRIAAAEKDGVASLVDGVLARWFTDTTRRERPDLVAHGD